MTEAQGFDKWWNIHRVAFDTVFCFLLKVDTLAERDAILIKQAIRTAFCGGAAAERAEHPDVQLEQQMAQIRESEREAARRHHLR